MLRRTSAIVVMLLASSLPVSAQNLGQAAARERERRGTAVVSAGASKGFSDEDLQRYVGQRLAAAPSAFPSDQTLASSDQTPASSGPLLGGEAPTQDALRRHLASAEAYLRQCEERLQAAQEGWRSASEASRAGAATQARRGVGNAVGALERAKAYRDQAEVAARVALALPAGLP